MKWLKAFNVIEAVVIAAVICLLSVAVFLDFLFLLGTILP
jgi:hypothetical protein